MAFKKRLEAYGEYARELAALEDKVRIASQKDGKEPAARAVGAVGTVGAVLCFFLTPR